MPVVSIEHLHQIALHADGIRLPGQTEPAGHALDMRIHNDPFVAAKRVAENDIRCLASHTREFDQLVHGVRDLATMLRDDLLCHPLDVPCLVSVEAGRTNETFELFSVRAREGLHIRVSLE